jgi:hypothetical protein
MSYLIAVHIHSNIKCLSQVFLFSDVSLSCHEFRYLGRAQ